MLLIVILLLEPATSLVMDYVRERGLPAVAMCVSTTYGPGGWGPTPHGSLIARVANGRFPFYLGFSAEVVGIEDAARAMILAGEHGRPGERYIVSDRYLSGREVHEIVADAVGIRAPFIGLPMPALRLGARANDLAARLLRRDLMFASVGLRMAELMSPPDHSKAERELGWKPEPVEDSLRRAARFFAQRENRCRHRRRGRRRSLRPPDQRPDSSGAQENATRPARALPRAAQPPGAAHHETRGQGDGTHHHCRLIPPTGIPIHHAPARVPRRRSARARTSTVRIGSSPSHAAGCCRGAAPRRADVVAHSS
ncbi:Rossmann-fold NAD(P)-binding domain-containing protein [Nocardia bovistercoris]|uniref:hypothetical protein n=1 Tax=Nocardia bovistercoris TaxID=2785916 RepID=UPI001E3E2954|nr:hypothetical protein [Nocardia bovistercoris]